MYLSPSLTPRNPPHDPSVRLYVHDRVSGRILNWTDFYLDVRDTPEIAPEIAPEISPCSAGLAGCRSESPRISPLEIVECAARLVAT